MNILVTGAAGFVGRNMCELLKTIEDGRNRTRPNLTINEIYEYDRESTETQLDEYCSKADWVLHFAGVNRPKDTSEFMEGNFGFTSQLIDCLRSHSNKASILITSSVQATLSGRFGNSEYGRSKLAGEELMFEYGASTGASVYVYRLPNLCGKWVRPNYNSAVGTFCNAIANDLPFTVNDPSVEMELVFIDDLMDEILDAMEGHAHRCEFNGVEAVEKADGRYCYVPVSHKVTLGQIVKTLQKFKEHSQTLMTPDFTPGSFEKKLYSMYLSYLPSEKTIFDLKMNVDDRGSFTELVHTANAGQVSVNITKPGITKGMHWHNLKTEEFIVVSGRARIRERNLLNNEVREYEVSGEKIQSVIMLPGYTHEITNIGNTDLVTIMTCNEIFDPNHPDTFYAPVVK